MVTINVKGDFKKTNTFMEKLLEIFDMGKLNNYGRMGVQALRENTPIDTGLLANSWSYSIERTKQGPKIVWSNDDIEGGYNVAILIQYGHAVKGGGYYPGKDFINPALQPVFEQIEFDLMRGAI